MRYPFRALLCLLLALTLTLPLTACDGGKFRDDVTAAQLADSVTASLSATDGWRQVSESYISASLWGEDYADYLDKVTEYRIVVSENSDMNIDEVGIFLCKSEKDAKTVAQFARDYVDTKKLHLSDQLKSYNPAELPKLDYATVNVMGRYVMYTLLSSADTTTAGSAMEKALTPAA
jgi:hypothetical protein